MATQPYNIYSCGLNPRKNILDFYFPNQTVSFGKITFLNISKLEPKIFLLLATMSTIGFIVYM